MSDTPTVSAEDAAAPVGRSVRICEHLRTAGRHLKSAVLPEAALLIEKLEGRCDPWSAFLHARARLALSLVAEGKTAEQIAEQCNFQDAEHVRRILERCR